MSEHMVIYGAGGHGKVIAEILAASRCTVLGFIDDDPALLSAKVFGLSIFSPDWLEHHRGSKVALGIGDNRARARAAARIREHGTQLVTAIHPSAIIARTAKLGEGVVVMAAAVLNPDCEIGEGAIVNTGAIVEHDVRLGRYAHLSPGCMTGGGARIGDYAHIGMGAMVLPLKTIGESSIVGAGAVVVDDIPDHQTASGIPARVHSPKAKSGLRA